MLNSTQDDVCSGKDYIDLVTFSFPSEATPLVEFLWLVHAKIFNFKERLIETRFINAGEMAAKSTQLYPSLASLSIRHPLAF